MLKTRVFPGRHSGRIECQRDEVRLSRSRSLPLRRKPVHQVPESRHSLLEVPDAVFSFCEGIFQFSIQTLDRCQRNSVGIDCGDAALVLTTESFAGSNSCCSLPEIGKAAGTSLQLNTKNTIVG